MLQVRRISWVRGVRQRESARVPPHDAASATYLDARRKPSAHAICEHRTEGVEAAASCALWFDARTLRYDALTITARLPCGQVTVCSTCCALSIRSSRRQWLAPWTAISWPLFPTRVDSAACLARRLMPKSCARRSEKFGCGRQSPSD